MKRFFLISLATLSWGLFLARGAEAAAVPAAGPLRPDPFGSYSLLENKMPSAGIGIWGGTYLSLSESDGSRLIPLDSSSLTKEQMQYVRKAKKWSNVSIFFLATNLAAFPIIFAVDDFAGGMISLVSLGGWMLSHGMAAFAYRDLDLSYAQNRTSAPSTKTPRYSHIISAAFGMGAMTGIGLIFNDDTGAAIAMTSICATVSWVSGIVAIIATHGYAKKVGAKTASESVPFEYSISPIRLKLSEVESKDRDPRIRRDLIYLPLAAVNF